MKTGATCGGQGSSGRATAPDAQHTRVNFSPHLQLKSILQNEEQIFIIIINLINNNNKYCIIPPSYLNIDSNKDGTISPDEIKRAYDILKKAGKLH